MNPSIIDVANAAGVSKSTVSRVLTGGSVSEKSRQAVYDAMERLNYSPNQMAQVLRGGSSKVIGVSMPTARYCLLRPYISIRLAGINDVLREYGYSLMIINNQDEEASESFRMLDNHLVDGLIFLGARDDVNWQNNALSHRQVVYTGERFDPSSGFRIYLGNFNYSRDLYVYLLGNGHRKIVTVVDFVHAKQIARRRQDACRDAYAMFHADIADAHSLKFFEEERNRELHLNQVYKKITEDGCTAIFADSTDLANELISYLTSMKLELLKDYSIVALERGVAPGLRDTIITSVCLPDFEYGRQCAKLLLEIFENKTMVCKDIIMPYTLEIRKSVRNITQSNGN